jgi:hypothetical protein
LALLTLAGLLTGIDELGFDALQVAAQLPGCGIARLRHRLGNRVDQDRRAPLRARKAAKSE